MPEFNPGDRVFIKKVPGPPDTFGFISRFAFPRNKELGIDFDAYQVLWDGHTSPLYCYSDILEKVEDVSYLFPIRLSFDLYLREAYNV